jgi:hypothetical protein
MKGLGQQPQEKSEPGEDAPEVVAAGSEDSVDGIAFTVCEEVAAHVVILPAMADHRLDGGAGFELPPERVRDAAFLALGVDFELVPLVAGIGEDAGQGCAGYGFDAGKNGFERMPVIGIAGQSLGVEDELPAL